MILCKESPSLNLSDTCLTASTVKAFRVEQYA